MDQFAGNRRPEEQRQTPAQPSVTPAHHNLSSQTGWTTRILVVLLIVLTILGIVILGSRTIGKATGDHAINGSEYQALFLTNGQVYFGKLSEVNNEYVKLTSIYYLQVQQAVQPADTKTQSQQQPQVSLAKLGSELHGPEDAMYVARSQVLFWENLKSDGKVTQAIQQYLKK